MSQYFYRVIPMIGGDAPSPFECSHEWERNEDTPNADAYCKRCRHYATLTEDERDRPVSWWKKRREDAQAAYSGDPVRVRVIHPKG